MEITVDMILMLVSNLLFRISSVILICNLLELVANFVIIALKHEMNFLKCLHVIL